MNAEFEKYHLIDRYLRGELDPEEMEAFENRLHSDIDFAEEVENQSNVNELISANSYHNLRQQISSDIRLLEKKEYVRKWIGRSFILLTLVFISGYIILRSLNTNSSSIVQSEDTNLRTELHEKYHKDPNHSISTVASDSISIESIDGKSENKLERPDVAEPDLEKYSVDTLKQASETTESKIQEKDSIIKEKTVLAPSKQNDLKEDSILEIKNLPILSDITEDCKSVSLKAKWKIEEACLNENNGSIMVDEQSVTGGKKPYLKTLIDGNTSVEISSFNNLPSGVYILNITDGSGCNAKWTIYVGEKHCFEKYVSISPDHGESWEFNGIDGESYYLSILNRAGQLVYKSGLLNGSTTWNGTSNSGSMAEAGLYIFIIEYTNGETVNGQITIMR